MAHGGHPPFPHHSGVCKGVWQSVGKGRGKERGGGGGGEKKVDWGEGV